MTNEEFEEEERKLRNFGKRVREGLAKTHALTEEQIEKVRQAAGEQWEREQQGRQSAAHESDLEAEQTAAQQIEEQKRKEEEERLRKEREESNEHGHGHSH